MFTPEIISGNDDTFALTIKDNNIDTVNTWLSSIENEDQNGFRILSVLRVSENNFATPRTGTITFTTASGEVVRGH